MQKPLRFILEGRWECMKLCSEIAKLSSSEAVLESSYVSDNQTMSNLSIAM